MNIQREPSRQIRQLAHLDATRLRSGADFSDRPQEGDSGNARTDEDEGAASRGAFVLALGTQRLAKRLALPPIARRGSSAQAGGIV